MEETRVSPAGCKIINHILVVNRAALISRIDLPLHPSYHFALLMYAFQSEIRVGAFLFLAPFSSPRLVLFRAPRFHSTVKLYSHKTSEHLDSLSCFLLKIHSVRKINLKLCQLNFQEKYFSAISSFVSVRCDQTNDVVKAYQRSASIVHFHYLMNGAPKRKMHNNFSLSLSYEYEDFCPRLTLER